MNLVTHQFRAMGCPCELRLFIPNRLNEERVIFDCVAEALRFEEKYSRYLPSSLASKINAASGTAASQKAFSALRLIVTVGWSIYPLGYIYGYAGGGDVDTLNLIYNLADFVNKIAFGVVIWAAATSAPAKKAK